MQILFYVLLVIGSYFIGNISNARILSKVKKDDITKHGSGNPGTMNMLRTYGFKTGLLTLFLDAIKGAVPALAGFLLSKLFNFDQYFGLYLAGISVVLGHNFPVFYKFKGGKGVACILGVFAVAEPLWASIAFLGCFLYLLIFDYGAMASFIFITSLTVIEAYKFRGDIKICSLLFILFFLTWFMHRQNIFRLLIGKENKVNLVGAIKKLKSKPKLTKDEKLDVKNEIKQKEIG